MAPIQPVTSPHLGALNSMIFQTQNLTLGAAWRSLLDDSSQVS